MSAKATVSNNKYLIKRKNRHGFSETIVYTGSLRNKPKGWKLVKQL